MNSVISGLNGRLRSALGINSSRTRRLLFLPAFYARQAGCSESEAWKHYQTVGWRASLDPHPLFSTDYFLTAYGKGAEFSSPLELYEKVSSVRAVEGTPFFQNLWYLNRNIDVAAASVDPFLHYLEFGAREGRQPNPWYEFLPFDLAPENFFSSFHSFDEFIERCDQRKTLNADWISNLLACEKDSAHATFWRRRYFGAGDWPLNPERIFGAVTNMTGESFNSLCNALSNLTPKVL